MLIDPSIVNDFEIVVGLVASVGTDLDSLTARISDELRIYNYRTETIRLSHLLDTDEGKESVGYYESRMDAGDALRAQAKSGDVLAALAIAKMLEIRRDDRSVRRAWVLRTLKHPHEVQLLREVFGQRFILVGVHEDLASRRRYLRSKLEDESPGENVAAAVEKLIERDHYDSSSKYGQQVRETYSSADLFVDLSAREPQETSRIVGLIFGEPFHTPSRDEVSMFLAYGASMRSSDPGRQVGAVIASADGEVIATGANEVPKYGGGEYWYGDPGDARDFQQGYDYNKRQSRRVVAELLDTLAQAGFLEHSLEDITSEQRMERLFSVANGDLKRTRIMSLIEFGRIVHAEMSALMHAARNPVSTVGATLYTTAYPCHMCMRLIVASGIARVVYVDPYPKSLASDMYSDSISEGSGRSCRDKVSVEPFMGVGWKLYLALFGERDRRRDAAGTFAQFDRRSARYRLADADPLLRAAELEKQVLLALSEAVGTNEDVEDSNIRSRTEGFDGVEGKS